jgi:DNA processing protein
LGADSIGHERAWQLSGKTVCVMPGGLDRPFPPENKGLWANLLEYSGAVMVSEAPFGMSASSLTLRKRNKLIVALSRGVLICQSSLTGGAMNAYRFALELRKAVAILPADENQDSSGNAAIAAKGANAVLDGSEAYEQWLRLLSSLT